MSVHVQYRHNNFFPNIFYLWLVESMEGDIENPLYGSKTSCPYCVFLAEAESIEAQALPSGMETATEGL
jgi:hypothetical protein